MRKNNSVNPLSEKYQEQYEKTVKDFVENLKKDKLKTKKYSLFFPMIGKDYFKKREILVMGIATNGWPNPWSCSSFKNSIIEKSINESLPEENMCAIDWVNEHWYDKNWRVRHSSFWQVTYKLIQAKYNCNDENWCCKMAWSNLYKIAPAYGGNPEIDIEWQSQYENCKKLFEMEIEELKPKNLLLITGLDWVCWGEGHFIEEKKLEKHNKNKYVKATGNFKNSNVIITIRPEYQNQEKFITEVIPFMV